MLRVEVLLLILTSMVVVAQANNEEIYTLYRNSAVDETVRIHMATFDTDDGPKTHLRNMTNCMYVQKLFQDQPHETNKFWCEKGAYRAKGAP
jgi:hypothetical protein